MLTIINVVVAAVLFLFAAQDWTEGNDLYAVICLSLGALSLGSLFL